MTVKEDEKIELLAEKFCDSYCKYPQAYVDVYEDPCEAQEALHEFTCSECPINMFIKTL